jgi:hypothetical protein
MAAGLTVIPVMMALALRSHAALEGEQITNCRQRPCFSVFRLLRR